MFAILTISVKIPDSVIMIGHRRLGVNDHGGYMTKVELAESAEKSIRVQEYGRNPAIDGVRFIELTRFNDEGGSMTELLRLSNETSTIGFVPAQVNYSEVEPGVVKAFHLHLLQTDMWFVPPGDRILLVLADLRKGSATEGATMRFMAGDGRNRLVAVPPGVAHGCRNLGREKARIIYFTDRHFSSGDDCDEKRLPWDFLGSEIWDIRRE